MVIEALSKQSVLANIIFLICEDRQKELSAASNIVALLNYWLLKFMGILLIQRDCGSYLLDNQQ